MALDFDNVPRLTREQAAIVSIFTGKLAGPFSDAHELADRLEPGITNWGMAIFADELADRARDLFVNMAAFEEETTDVG